MRLSKVTLMTDNFGSVLFKDSRAFHKCNSLADRPSLKSHCLMSVTALIQGDRRPSKISSVVVSNITSYYF